MALGTDPAGDSPTAANRAQLACPLRDGEDKIAQEREKK